MAVDPNIKVLDLYLAVADPRLEVVDLKQEVPERRSSGIRPNLTPGVNPITASSDFFSNCVCLQTYCTTSFRLH